MEVKVSISGGIISHCECILATFCCFLVVSD